MCSRCHGIQWDEANTSAAAASTEALDLMELFELDLRLLEDCISRTIDYARPNTAQQDL